MQPLAQLCVTPQVQTPFLAAIAGAVRRRQDVRAEAPGAGDRRAQRFAGGGRRRARRGWCVARSTLRAASRRRWRSPAPPMPRSIASPAASTIRPCWTRSAMPAAIRIAPRGRRPTVMTISCRKLEAERSQRDEVEAKRARLADTLAFETPGSRIDVFARARRGTIEAQLRRFGLAGSDADVELPQSGARHVDARRGRPRCESSFRVDMGLRQPGAAAPVGDRRLRARPSASAFLHGETALAAIERRERLAEAGRGLDRGARRLVRPGGGDPVSSSARWRSRSTCGARFGFSNLLLRGARLLNLRGPRTAPRPRRSAPRGSISASPR